MSEVNASDLTEINEASDVFDLYAGAGKNAQAGIEVELTFINPEDPDLSVMSLSQNRVLKNSAVAAMPDSDWVHNEPTSELLEVASIAAPFSDARFVLDDVNNKIKILCDKAEGIGLKRSYFQELPERSAEDLLTRIMDVERYKIMYAPYREDMTECVRYFAICKSNQVSISPYNMDHMLENIRRLYTLAPFLFLLTDNSVGFSEGKKFKDHAAMTLRHKGLDGWQGGMPDFVFQARSGEEFIASHIDHIMNHPLFMYYDREGNLNRVPSGDKSVTFNSLKSRGLNISSNYFLAQSIFWPDVKIATLKDSSGDVTGHRYEGRMFGVGMHQHQSAFIIMSALAFNDNFARGVDDLLMRYGFDNNDLAGSHDLVKKSYKTAREHGGNFFNIAYGTGIMAEFAKEFADLIEAAADDMGLDDEIQPLLTICRTGCTDGKINRILFPTLQDSLEFQKTYDRHIFDNPNMCARTLFEKELIKARPDACASISAAQG